MNTRNSAALDRVNFALLASRSRINGRFSPEVFHRLIEIAVEKAEYVASATLRYTAADVRQSAQRSIKSGGKSPKSKNYSFSKPGEPPKYHRSTLKQGIQYEKSDDGYLIGPERVGASSTLRTLEYGGKGSFSETVYTDEYANNRRAAKRKQKTIYSRSYRCAVHGTVRATRPKATRPYYVYSKAYPRGRLVRDYLYFYSTEEWDAARNSPRFQDWAKRQRTTSRVEVDVAPRPFMRPALARETTSTKNSARMTRAIRASK